MPRLLAKLALTTLLVLLPARTLAADVTVAVAANFAAPMKLIVADFERNTAHKVTLAFGASGQFYAQIRHGAPFEMLLSADDDVPRKLEREGLAVPGTRFTYAVGRLALWSRDPQLIDVNGDVLRSGRFERLAIANPKLAPYGRAATEVIERMKLTESLATRIVQGTNISQAFKFVASGNAALGFVAVSQVVEDGQLTGGSVWFVPTNLHAPIKQDAVLLAKARDNPAALALLDHLKGDRAKTIIRSFGYEI